MRMARGVRSAVALASTLALGLGAAACKRNALPPRPDGAAVVVTTDAPSVEGDVVFSAEAEPNDTLAAAQKLGLGATPALGVNGQLHEPQGKSRDTDLFRIDVPPEAGAAPPVAAPDGGVPGPRRRALHVEVRPEGTLALGIELLDDQGQPLASTGVGQPGEAMVLPNLAVSPGAYHLRVRADIPVKPKPAPGGQAGQGGAPASAGPYRLVARLGGPLEPGAEVEPNGKAATATELAAPGEAVGFYGWRRDQDWYRVPTAGLAEGSVLGVDLEPAPGVTASLLVFDSVEQKLTEARGRKEERVSLRSVRVPTGEPYVYVVVRTDAGTNAETRYNLRLTAELPKAGGEVEPNDDPAHAQAIADVAEGGAATVAGYLGRGDLDVFRYTASVPVELDVEAVPPERVDLKLEILRPDGTVLAKADTGKRREPERLPNVFVPGGTALVRLTPAKGDGNTDEPYRLTIAARPPEPGGEHEPNDTIATPTALPPGAVGSGLVAPRGDADFWSAAAAADAEGNVTVSVGGVPGLTLDVRVRATAGKELGRFKVAGDGAPGTNTVSTGGEACCVVEIREATGKATNPRDRYSVAVGK
jgi:hypothetical protein